MDIVRIPPFFYVHILDCNTNLTKVIEGPLTYILKDHQRLATGSSPLEMVKIPPMYYCVIGNPVIKVSGKLIEDDLGLIKVKYGDKEIRTSETHPDPFPLYPFEVLERSPAKIPVVLANHALMIRALRDFEGHQAGDEWLFVGPSLYIPRIDCEIVANVDPLTIKPNSAAKIRAKRTCKDSYGIERNAGEEWLIRETGDYLPQVNEEFLEHVQAIILTKKTALHLRALKNYVDVYDVPRKVGEDWLLTVKDTDSHILDVYERLVDVVKAIVLTNRQYCYILNPVDSSGKNQFGKKELKKGECTFFLNPFEILESGIQDIAILADDEALLLKAIEYFIDESGQKHLPGEKWMIYGPCDYTPPVQVQVLERRKRIPLDEGEGIYVRDTITGEIKAEIGKSYLLKPQEILYELNLPPDAEELVCKQLFGTVFQRAWEVGSAKVYKRDKTQVIAFRVPHNSAVQVYDYKKKCSRVVFGPDRIMLQPDEQFTIMELSGGIPKKEKIHKNLALMLGPDFMGDLVIVETSDHASLALTLSYNWHFEIDKNSPEDAAKLFQVKDFVGDSCKTIASRIRGAVSAHTFEDFHQRSSTIIKSAVFGKKGDEIRPSLHFPSNGLVITNIDIQSIEPTDQKTKMSLKKSVIQAIEIVTEANKARAEHEALKNEQHSEGLLNLQKVNDLIESEKEQIKVSQIKAKNLEVQLIGKAMGDAMAEAKSKKIYYESLLQKVELEEQARKVESETNLSLLSQKNSAEIDYRRELNLLEIKKANELAKIETDKFKQVMGAIGKDAIISMAKAGPELQSRLLKGLGLKGFAMMNSKNPINLFTTANGLIPK
jgi:major vault protein